MAFRSVEEALLRHRHMQLAVRRLGEAVRAGPAAEAFLKVGLTTTGGSMADIRSRAAVRLDHMELRLAHFAIVDMCSAFEAEFGRRLGTAIGDVRKAAEQLPGRGPFAAVRVRLVREEASFGSLDSMFALIDGLVSPATFSKLKRLRNQRNAVAHGGNLDEPLEIGPEEARDLLVEVAKVLWP